MRCTSVEQFERTEIPQEFLNESAVILLEEEHVEISGNSAIYELTLIKKIQKTGHQEEGTFHFGTNRYSKILAIEGCAIYPDGRTEIISSDDIDIVSSFSEFFLYSDQKSYSFKFSGTVAGTVIKVHVKRKIENLVYWQPAVFIRDIPILTRRYTLVHPDNLDFAMRASIMPDTPIRQEKLDNGKTKLVWEQRNIEPFRRENMMPSGLAYLPSLWFSIRGKINLGAPLELDSWGGVVSWYKEISKESLEPGSRLRLMVDTLRIAGMSERESAAKIFSWVQENLRYVAIYLGDGGFRPHKTEEVLKNRYGDCKDKSVVLSSALREVGIDAYLVLVRTSALGYVPDAPPSPSHFNHAIVTAIVDGDTVYLDPTCEMCSFGVLPYADQNAEALVIRDGEINLITLPCNRPRPNRSDVSTEAVIMDDGSANIKITMELDGYFAAEARRALIYREGNSRREVLAAILRDKMPAVRVENVIIDGQDPASNILTIRIEGIVPGMLDTEQPYSFIRAVLNPLDIELPDCRRRVYPIALGVPSSSGYTIFMVLPDHWHVCNAPESGKIQNDYLNYNYTWNVDGRKIFFSRSWSIMTPRILATDCSYVRSHLEEVVNIEKAMIATERK